LIGALSPARRAMRVAHAGCFKKRSRSTSILASADFKSTAYTNQVVGHPRGLQLLVSARFLRVSGTGNVSVS
jgi:hypothetical protein